MEQTALIFLQWTTAIVLIVVTCFVVKLLIDLSKLTKSLTETSNVLNEELKPTLQNLSATLKVVNDLVKSTDDGITNVKSAIDKIIGKTKSLGGNFFTGLLKGITTVIGFFGKK